MTKEIGSDFAIPFSILYSRKKNNTSEEGIFLSSGRDCISAIIEHLNIGSDDKVLLPSYLCESIIKPFNDHNIKVEHYKVNKKLEIDIYDLKKRLKESKEQKEKPKAIKAILVINYFGFIQPKRDEIKRLSKQENVFLIEDDVQSSMSEYYRIGDFTFNSYRKFMPIPDGALLKGIREEELRKSIRSTMRHKLFWMSRACAGMMKNIRILKPAYRFLAIRSESSMINNYKKPAPISSLSRKILMRTDLEEIKSRRRENYRYLAKRINELKNKDVQMMFDDFPKNVCPLGFPIIFNSMKERDHMVKQMIKSRIYLPIHWKLPSSIDRAEFKESWQISERIMTIPIDQRYDKGDMDRIVEQLKL